MTPLDKIKAIIFDWDGTLADSVGPIVSAIEKTILAAGLPPQPPGKLQEVVGLGLTEGLRRLYPEQDPATERTLMDACRSGLSATAAPVPLFDGVPQVIQSLHGEYLLGIATGKGRQGLKHELRRHGLTPYFLSTRCGDQAPSKPHPAMLLEVIEELGVAADEALMVGDTVFDLEMAGRAGVPALALSCGVHSRQRLLEWSPVAVLDHVASLPRWLQRNKHDGSSYE